MNNPELREQIEKYILDNISFFFTKEKYQSTYFFKLNNIVYSAHIENDILIFIDTNVYNTMNFSLKKLERKIKIMTIYNG